MDGWVDGWMEGKAGLRIAYSNQKITPGTFIAYDIRVITSKGNCLGVSFAEQAKFSFLVIDFELGIFKPFCDHFKGFKS